MQFRFTCDYSSSYGTWREGEIVDLDDATAAWMLRDVPGCIEPVTAKPTPKAQDRQVKAAPKKRGS